MGFLVVRFFFTGKMPGLLRIATQPPARPRPTGMGVPEISAASNTRAAPVADESCAASMMVGTWICLRMASLTRSLCGAPVRGRKWDQ